MWYPDLADSDSPCDETVTDPYTDECVFEPVLAKRSCDHNKKVGIVPTLS